MFEIVPNWHPVFVHFPIALLMTATALFVLTACLPGSVTARAPLRLVALWNLWLGFAAALVAASFGWIAYNTVAHDALSHEAMTTHRNWALLTLGLFLPVIVWSVFTHRRGRTLSWFFALILMLPTLFLARTAWLGAEAVYRHGLGVQRLPDTAGGPADHGHDPGAEHRRAPVPDPDTVHAGEHAHDHDAGEPAAAPAEESSTPPQEHDHDDHPH